jgi:formate C-acetyltransferase
VRVDVDNFLVCNRSDESGDDSSLTGPTDRTQALCLQARMLLAARQATACRPSVRGQVALCWGPEYLDRREELIFGLPRPPGERPNPTDSAMGDWRKVALYGTACLQAGFDPDDRQLACEAQALAMAYGLDIRRPAASAQQAIQWTYLAFLGAIEAGKTVPALLLVGLDGFFDIYLQRDLERGILIEEEAQELIDDLCLKLRLVRTGEGDEGEPNRGLGLSVAHPINQTSFRLVNTLYTLGPTAEPQLVVVWSAELPATFRRFCSEVSIDTSALRFVGTLPLSEEGKALSLTPETLGEGHEAQVASLTRLIDHETGGGAVLGINVYRRELLEAALARPHKYGYLTVQLPPWGIDLRMLSLAGRQRTLRTVLGTLN